MKTLVRLTLIALALLTLSSFALLTHAQTQPREASPVQWTFALARPAAVGEEVEIIITAQIAPHWIVYSSDFKAELGPQPTRLVLEAADAFRPVGEFSSVGAQRKKDKTWDTEFGYFERRAEFRQKVKILQPAPVIAGRITGQLCNERDGTCTLFEQAFKL